MHPLPVWAEGYCRADLYTQIHVDSGGSEAGEKFMKINMYKLDAPV